MNHPRIARLIAATSMILGSCLVTVGEVDEEWYAVPDVYPANSVNADTEAFYEATLEDATADGFPGFAVLVDGPEGFWAGGGGLADIANDVSVAKNSLFRIGSVTKTFTAALILDLEEDGFLSVDDAIAPYLSDEIVEHVANARSATIRELMNHRSGIPNYYGFTLWGLDYAAAQLNDFTNFILSKEELIEYVYDRPADFSPGDDWAYSNTNYVLLALIAERITGTDFSDLLQERIFEPLGLENSYVESETPTPGLVRGYDALFGDNRLYDVTDDIAGPTGDGGIISNTYDIAKFFRALFDLELFGQEELDEMVTQYPFNRWGSDPVQTSGYGLGLFYEATDGVADYFAHYGYVYGYGADAYYFPGSDTMVVMLTNMTNNPRAGEKSEDLRDLLWSFD